MYIIKNLTFLMLYILYIYIFLLYLFYIYYKLCIYIYINIYIYIYMFIQIQIYIYRYIHIFIFLVGLQVQYIFEALMRCFLYIWVFFQEHLRFTGHQGKGEGNLFNSSLLLPPISRALRDQPYDNWRELTSAHSQQPDSVWEPLVCECKPLTTELRALKLTKLHALH